MPRRFKLLLADDEPHKLLPIVEYLKEQYDIETVLDGREAINAIQSAIFDVILLDVAMPHVDGIEVLRWIQDNYPSLQVIMIMQNVEVEKVVQATRLGAFEVLRKPFEIAEIENVIELALDRKKLATDNSLLKTELSRRTGEIIGQSDAILQVIESVRRVAESDSIVLVQGGSGTGKELIANLVHQSSPRRDRPFVPVNCSSIPDSLLETELFGHEKGAFTNAYAAKPGLAEVANGGTLFLDEVGDISPVIQPKLLRFLETGDFRRVGGTNELKADVRVVSATNKNLVEEARAGRFREDLLYRLNVITIRVPPLVDHREDIPLLVDYFLKKKSRLKEPKHLSPRALAALMEYDWPGNVRELEHIIEGAVILSSGQTIDSHDLHLSDRQHESVPESLALESVEKMHIEKVLKLFNGNRKKTAEALKISEKGLYLKIKEYHIPVH